MIRTNGKRKASAQHRPAVNGSPCKDVSTTLHAEFKRLGDHVDDLTLHHYKVISLLWLLDRADADLARRPEMFQPAIEVALESAERVMQKINEIEALECTVSHRLFWKPEAGDPISIDVLASLLRAIAGRQVSEANQDELLQLTSSLYQHATDSEALGAAFDAVMEHLRSEGIDPVIDETSKRILPRSDFQVRPARRAQA